MRAVYCSVFIKVGVIEIDNSDYIVYCHINKLNGKRYVGLTKQNPPEKRWKNGRGYKHSTHFSSAINKYGWDAFEHNIIGSNLSEKFAKDLEVYLIAEWNTRDREYGYNTTSGGEHNYGRVVSEEERKRIGDAHRGKKQSEETKQKISRAEKGKKFSEEHRRRISEALSGEKSYMFGKHLTQEQKDTLSNSHKGTHQSNDWKMKRLHNLHMYHVNNLEPISKYTLDGKYVAEYRNVLEAADSVSNLSRGTINTIRSSIRQVAKGYDSSAYGFVWKWSDGSTMDNHLKIMEVITNEF